jgi:spermidine synthase
VQIIIYICFLLSGATGLVFENLWVRMLTLVFGATSLAVSSVLTAYMGGLALGSWLFGRWADRIRSPLRAYALVEIAVGAVGLLVPLVVQSLYPSLNAWLWSRFEPGYFAFSFLRFVFSTLLLIVPTTLMGGTLPILSKALVQTRGEMEHVGSNVGWLYAANTTGAVLGTFFCGFVLLPAVGLSLTNLSAALTNLLVIGGPLLLLAPTIRRALDSSRALAEPVLDSAARRIDEAAEAVRGASPAPLGKTARVVVLLAFGFSGLASMNYQVIWSRVLSMVIGSSVYAFALILMAFLVGIALGSSVMSAVLRRRPHLDHVSSLAFIQLFIAAMAVLDYFLVDDYPYWFASMVTQLDSFYEHVGLVQTMMFGIAALALLPVTLGMGATMPLTVAALSSRRSRLGRDVGNIYAINTVGAIVGSFASAFIFVPGLSRIGLGYGLQWSYLLSVALNVALFVALILVSTHRRVGRLLAVLVPALLAVIVAGVIHTHSMWDPARLTIGAFRISLADDVLDEETWGEPEISYYFDGVSTTVSVERWGQHMALKNNGKVDASSGDDMVTQIMVSAYPLLFHPRTPSGRVDAAIIGFGSGVTVGAAMQFPVASVDVVELEPAVVESSRLFEPYNFLSYGEDGWPYVMMDGLEVVSNDGRNFLVSGVERYDVVISEPSNPWITGVSNLFTEDHYHAATESLAPGGIYCQWIQLYEMSLGNIKTLFKTFATVFPYVTVFAADPLSSDTIMLGSFEPLTFDLDRVEALFGDPGVAAAMAAAGIADPHDVAGRIIFASRAEVLEYCGDAPVNTDDNALIEFAAPRDLIGFEKLERSASEIYSEDWEYGNLDQILNGYGTGVEAASHYAELALALASCGRYDLAGHMIVKSGHTANSELGELAVLVLANLASDENDPEVVFDPPVPGPAMDPATENRFWSIYDRCLDRLLEGDAEGSLEELLRIPDVLLENSGPGLRFLHAYLLYYNGLYEDSIDILEQLRGRPDGFARANPEVYYYLAKAHDRSYNYRSAVSEMRSYVLMRLARRLEQKARRTAASAGSQESEQGAASDGGNEEDITGQEEVEADKDHREEEGLDEEEGHVEEESRQEQDRRQEEGGL